MTKPFLPIIAEHADFIVVNKPTGVSMHWTNDAHMRSIDPLSQVTYPSLDLCNSEHKLGICDLLQRQHNLEKVYLVHRLDSDTSGCLLLAKNKSSAAQLSKQFAQRTVTKYYLAVSDHKPKKKQGKIQGIMKKSRGGSYVLRVAQAHCPSNDMAVTFFFSQLMNNGKRVFYLKPVTGKTHQIRVALKSLGSTILGDKRYKGTFADRLHLHSHVLKFEHLGEQFSVKCLPQTSSEFNDSFFNALHDPEDMQWPNYIMPREKLNRDLNL